MEAIIKEQINDMELGSPESFKNMTIFPLSSSRGELNYLTLKEALTAELLIISEIDNRGAVPEIKVFNHAELPVLLLDGEELVGAKQNRILNTTVLLKEKTETIIPVSCTESGRWSYSTPHFKDSDTVATCRVRRNKTLAVNKSLEFNGKYRSDQGRIWEDIRNISQESDTKSPTNAMRDIYQARETELKDYINSFSLKESQNGILVIINGKVAGLDYISSPIAYQELHQKLVKSYALEALINPKSIENTNSSKIAQSFLNIMKKSKVEKHNSVGYGYDYRFQSPQTVGSSLIYGKEIIHAAFFGREEFNLNSMSSIKQRRSFRL